MGLIGLRIGLDLGKQRDPSAMCSVISGGEGSNTIYDIPYIERFDLGMSYPDQVNLLEKKAMKALEHFNQHVEKQQIGKQNILKPALYGDVTGLGDPVFDLIRKTSIPRMFKLFPVRFMYGDKLSRSGNGYLLGKEYFVTRLLVLSQNKRIRLNAKQKLKNPFLFKEFQEFDIDVDEASAKATYGAMRPGSHDDQVCASGLACLIDNPRTRSFKVPEVAAFENYPGEPRSVESYLYEAYNSPGYLDFKRQMNKK